MPPSPSQIFYLYGAFLIVGGFLAFAMANFEARAKTAIMMGCGCGTLMSLIGWFGETRPHLIRFGRILCAFFLCLFIYRGYKIRDVPEKQYLFICFIILSVGTAITLLTQMIAANVIGKNYSKRGGVTVVGAAAASASSSTSEKEKPQ